MPAGACTEETMPIKDKLFRLLLRPPEKPTSPRKLEAEAFGQFPRLLAALQTHGDVYAHQYADGTWSVSVTIKNRPISGCALHIHSGYHRDALVAVVAAAESLKKTLNLPSI